MRAKDSIYLKTLQRLFSIGIFLLVATAISNTCAHAQMSAREHILRGNQFLNRRAFQQAIDEYQEALKLDPNNATAKGNILVSHNNWGMYYALKKDWAHANQEFETCLQIDPGFHDAQRNLTLLRRDMAKDSEVSQDKPWDPRADEEKGINSFNAAAKKTESKKVESKKPDQPESPSAVILTPGIKSSTSKESTTQLDSNKDAQANPSQAPAEANYGGQYFNINKSPVSGTIEDQLSSVEVKVYGHKQEDMPVLKRLEKLEIDTSGTISQGTIKERLEHLKQTSAFNYASAAANGAGGRICERSASCTASASSAHTYKHV